MQLDKAQVLDFVRQQMGDDKAAEADRELPQQVDTDADSGLLDKLGVNPMQLAQHFLGGGSEGGIGGALGGVLGGH